MSIIRSLLKPLFVFAAAVAATGAVWAEQTPIISFHTQVYDNAGPDNAFHFVIGSTSPTTISVDCGFGAEEMQVTEAVYDPSTQVITGTTVVCSVSEEGMVNIYGDASLIDYLDLEGCYIDHITFPELTNLEILNMDHNKLAELNLSTYTKLQAIYLNDNPFDGTPLVIGGNKPDLTILEISIVDHLDQSFTLTDYPALQVFRAFHCSELHTVDPSQCPELLVLSFDVTPVSSVDVSNNPKLLVLNTSDTYINSVDVSANAQLQQLFCSHTGQIGEGSRLTDLDVSNNPDLIYLFCAGNELTTLDISHNAKLKSLSAYSNLLPTIDFSANPDIVEVDIHNNYMDFVTLPEPRPTFLDYVYNQRPFAVERSYKVGTELDFSAKVNRPGTRTSAVLCKINSSGYPEPLDASYYSWADGKMTLNKAFNDSVYVVFSNTLFTDYSLETARFMVKSEADYGKPSPMLSFGVPSSVEAVNFSVGIAGATAENPVPFFVNFGDGNQVEFSATSSAMPVVANAEGTRAGRITVYIPEGHDITAFGIDGTRLTSVDLSKAKTLQYLSITDAGLSKIDLDNNWNLRSINLADNEFVTISVFGETNHAKNMLSYLNLSGNKLVAYDLEGHVATVDLSNNELISVGGVGGDQVHLNLANNLLTSVDLSKCELLESLNVSGNKLNYLDFSNVPVLTSVDISNNKFLFGDMPDEGAFEDYVYAPQAKFILADKAPMADLSALCYPDIFSESEFTWLYADNNEPVPADKIRKKKGVFYFEDTALGSIYCSVTNPYYPQFTGQNAMMTTPVEVVGMPTVVCTTFKTSTDQTAEIILAGAEEGTTVYIDWAGDGNVSQYILGTTYKIFPVTAVAGADVKVLAYGQDCGVTVFSLDGVKLSNIDASSLTQAYTFGLYNTGIKDGQYTLPQNSGLQELSITGSYITSIDLTPYTQLYSLNLSDNNLSELDVTGLENLGVLEASKNILSSMTFNNENLWHANFSDNELESIDLSGAPFLSQLYLTHNQLSEIDVEALNQLRVLRLDFNRFTFATLPAGSSNYYEYIYWNQLPMDVEQVDGYVDLSSQAEIRGTETIYSWYKGVPYFDDYGELTGDLLEDGGDYFIENGVTGFYESFIDIMCVMRNSRYPLLYLYTNLIDVEDTGLGNVSAETSVTAYTDGNAIVVKAPADVAVAVYAVNGVEVARSATAAGEARIEGLEAGVYMVRAGSRVFKLALK